MTSAFTFVATLSAVLLTMATSLAVVKVVLFVIRRPAVSFGVIALLSTALLHDIFSEPRPEPRLHCLPLQPTRTSLAATHLPKGTHR